MPLKSREHWESRRYTNVKKEALLISIWGLAFGIALGQLIAIVISVVKGDGMFYAVVPELMSDWGTELNAVIVQAILLGVLGTVLGEASVVWEFDSWSLTKQTLTHFCLFAVPFTVIAYVLYWIPRFVGGVIASTVVFIAIYAAIWCGSYFSYKRKVKQINDELHKS